VLQTDFTAGENRCRRAEKWFPQGCGGGRRRAWAVAGWVVFEGVCARFTARQHAGFAAFQTLGTTLQNLQGTTSGVSLTA
jgi:hypothetical protein